MLLGKAIRMSETILLSGKSNVLESVFSPPIFLDPKKTHYVGLVEFVAFNSIPNVDHTNQTFRYYGPDKKEILIPRGAYEIEAINQFLQDKIGAENIELKANNSTLRCSIKSKFEIDFDHPGSIGPMLGFSPKVYPADEQIESEFPVLIMTVQTIRIECNVASGSYVNGALSHTIFAFSPNVPPGYKMTLSPRTIIYNRINTHVIDRLRISIVDQDGRPVDFGEELVTVRLHIKSSDG